MQNAGKSHRHHKKRQYVTNKTITNLMSVCVGQGECQVTDPSAPTAGGRWLPPKHKLLPFNPHTLPNTNGATVEAQCDPVMISTEGITCELRVFMYVRTTFTGSGARWWWASARSTG